MNNQPTSLNCPACGAPLDADGTSTIVHCKFCGNVSLLPAQAGAPTSTLDGIRQLAGGGNLTEAIERYRQAYGVDQDEAKQAIDALQAGRLVTSSAPGMRAPEELTTALEEVQRLLSAGNKIEAIKVYREHFDVSLERAKYAIDQIEAGQTLRPEMGFAALGTETQTAGTTGPAVQKSRSRGCLGTVIVGVVVVAVIGLVGYFMFQSGFFSTTYSLSGPVALVPSEQGAGPNFAAEFYNSDKDKSFIGLLDQTSHKLSWQAAYLSGQWNVSAVAAGTDLIYTANGPDLLAYHISDGSLAWQTEMPDNLNDGTALLVTAGRVITDTANQTIQAYDAETGSPAWNKSLVGEDHNLRLMGNSLVVMDYTDSNNDTYGLLFLDPATGSQQSVITPTCNYNDETSTLDTGSGLIYDSSGNALFLVYDSSYGCVQRLDLATGKITWEADSQQSFDFSSDGFQALLTNSNLYFSNANDLLAVDKSTGHMKVLLTNPDYTLLPLALAGNNLIVRAYRTRGTGIFELWGVDVSSGSSVWQLNLQGAQPIDPPDVMSGMIDNNDTGWTWKLVSAGLVVIKFQGQPNQLILETFDPETGNSLGTQTIALNNINGDFYDIPAVIAWQNNVVYINLDSKICALDLSTGKLTVIY